MKSDQYRIVEYRTLKRKSARRGHPALEADSILWLIEYSAYRDAEGRKRYFSYGYVLKTAAAKVAARLEGTEREIEFNSVADPEGVMQSWIEPLEIR